MLGASGLHAALAAQLGLGHGPAAGASNLPCPQAIPCRLPFPADEVDRVLPVVPFSQQAAYFAGSTTDSVQRWGASLAATVVLSKVCGLAAPALGSTRHGRMLGVPHGIHMGQSPASVDCLQPAHAARVRSWLEAICMTRPQGIWAAQSMRACVSPS